MRDFLKARTGQPASWWFQTVQQAVARASTPRRWTFQDAANTLTRRERHLPKARRDALIQKRLSILKAHTGTDVAAWLREVSDKVRSCAPRAGLIDGNVWTAATLGYVLLYWYAQIQKAKGYDPRRPVAIRRKALLKRQKVLDAVLEDIVADVDEAGRKLCRQEWNDPFGPDARGGTFV